MKYTKSKKQTGKSMLGMLLILSMLLSFAPQVTVYAQREDFLEQAGTAVDSNVAVLNQNEENSAIEDKDYDGIPDSMDKAPEDNNQKAVFRHIGSADDTTYDIEYKVDYRWFFGNNKSFNKDLNVLSSLFSALAYYPSSNDPSDSSKDYYVQVIDGTTGKMMDIMKRYGLEDVTEYNLYQEYKDNHGGQFNIGHRQVSYEGKTREIININVRGSYGSLKDWTSNFEIGNTESNYNGWTNKNNHLGFDVVAARMMKEIEEYILENVDAKNELVFWVTGHSRGAAIANIISADLVDQGYVTFAYTYAAPNTTTSEQRNADRYQCIFNITNKDDFVPLLPLTSWNFGRYGRTAAVTFTDAMEKEWEKNTGKLDYNPDRDGLDKTVAALEGVSETRNGCYHYTCSCHGDKSSDDITITNYGVSESSRNKAIAKIPENAIPYCCIEKFNDKILFVKRYNFTVCQSPMYFMQLLAAQMSGKINVYRFIVELNIAEHYEDAKDRIMLSGNPVTGGIEHPHYLETYHIISKYVTAASFR